MVKKIATPKQHQKEAIRLGLAHYSKHDNGKLIMPCGSGKTLTALWIADALKIKRLIIVLPTLQLQTQAIENWISNIESDATSHKVIVVGSNTYIKKNFDVTVTTSHKILTSELLKSTGKYILVITTYQSSDVLASVCLENEISFDMAIFDEAHHTAGMDKINFQALLIKDNALKIEKKLFMTATPKVFDNNRKGEVELYSMDDEGIYGKEFYRLTTNQAIKEGIISDYKVVTMYASDSETIRLINSKGLLKDKQGKGIKADARMIAVGLSTLKAIKRLKLRHVICFTSTVERSKTFKVLMEVLSQQLNQPLDSFQISHLMRGKERQLAIDAFYQSKCSLISNARILGEGVDLPAVDATVFVDEKGSVSGIVQAAGRAWRVSPGKSYGYVLVPCLINNNRILNDDLIVLRRVFSALGTTDERIYNYFKYYNKTSAKRIRTISSIEKPTFFDLDKFNHDLNISVWKNLSQLEGRDSRYLPWEETAKFTLSLSRFGINNVIDYKKYCRNPDLFPAAPARPENIPVILSKAYRLIYREELFFKDRIRYNNYAPCQQAASFIQGLGKYGVINRQQFKKYAKDHTLFKEAPPLPVNIPKEPWRVYGENYKSRIFFSQGIEYGRAEVKEILDFVLSLRQFGITRRTHWEDYCYHPEKYPKAPPRPFNIPIKLSYHLKEKYDRKTFFPASRPDKDMPWEEASAFIKSLRKYGVTTLTRWLKYKRKSVFVSRCSAGYP